MFLNNNLLRLQTRLSSLNAVTSTIGCMAPVVHALSTQAHVTNYVQDSATAALLSVSACMPPVVADHLLHKASLSLAMKNTCASLIPPATLHSMNEVACAVAKCRTTLPAVEAYQQQVNRLNETLSAQNYLLSENVLPPTRRPSPDRDITIHLTVNIIFSSDQDEE